MRKYDIRTSWVKVSADMVQRDVMQWVNPFNAGMCQGCQG